jgi:hypothetical protein
MPSRAYQEIGSWVSDSAPRLGRTRLIVVDGPAGSGKTTFAMRLAAVVRDARVLHLDDFYEGWTGLDERLWSRLRSGVLEPLAQDEPGRYQCYDWNAGRFLEWRDVAPGGTLILEGVGSASRATDKWTTLRVWVEAPEPMRLQRGLARDGASLRDEWLRWMTLESAHFSADDTRRRAHLLIDGSTVTEASSYVLIEDRRCPG